MTKAYGAKKPETIYLKDYQAPAYAIRSIDLVFDVYEEFTIVKSTLEVERQEPIAENLFLSGIELELLKIKLNGNEMGKDEYQQHNHGIELHNLPNSARLEIETRLYPHKNTSLMGLYQSSGNLCTQCEPEGFRKITYFLDRPDVLSVYTTTIIADREKFPILLSNGNPVDQGQEGDRHWAKWYDPHPKPSYLFALVAGDLVNLQDHYVTQSGKKVDLFIYTQKHNHDKCAHAMLSLKNAMQWDEKTYGREYDLDVYMVVAVDDFNMGAMENKGLNIFNSKYVLAKPETATDSDYQGIEGVIGHEYFHNWSGNRVTCRDWFQLSLKEGFTVFRDQEFSADMGSRGVKRIEDVNILRSHQFREDAGPMSHPVRPDSYVEINNFYTLTVYNKGAEVIRMLYQLLGAENFRKGTDLYFDRHDGQAVTTEDFVKALEDANRVDLTQFKNWYKQAGTPELLVKQKYEADKNQYTLCIEQTCPVRDGEANKEAFQIPIAVGLLNSQGQDMQVSLEGNVSRQHILDLKQFRQEFIFQQVTEAPIPSLLREFSAPVKINFPRSEDELAFLMAHDTDAFNRWDAGQQLGIKLILQMVDDLQNGRPMQLSESIIQAFRKILNSSNNDYAMEAECLRLPGQAYLSEFMPVIDVENLHLAWRYAHQTLAKQLKDEFLQKYQQHNKEQSYETSATAIGERCLKNTCLSYLLDTGEDDAIELCLEQYHGANNMTDVMAALSAINHYPGEQRQACLSDFYDKWKDEALVVDKWLTLQATSYLPNTLDQVKQLTKHESFSIKNPNKVRSLIGAFCAYNHAQFHCNSGKAYSFLTENIIQLDSLNPQIAARLCTPFTQWRRYPEELQNKMATRMQRILAVPNLSKDVYEIISKSLDQ